jgi:CheY-like chemotaxis protein
MNQTTILVVEDSPDHRNLIRLVLVRRLTNIRVATVVSSEEAIAYLEAQDPPDLIVLDLWLGHINGFDLLIWLAERERLAEIPTIMFTSSAEPQHASHAYQLGARRYMTKPADFNELVTAIQEELGRWSEPGAEASQAGA